MSEQLKQESILRLLGFGTDNISPKDMAKSEFFLYPRRVGKICAALAGEFASDQISAVVGTGYVGSAMALFLAHNLSVLTVESSSVRHAEIVALAPHYETFLTGLPCLTLVRHEAELIKNRRVVLAAPYASRRANIRELSTFCHENGATDVLLAVIANFGCSPEELGVTKIRSLLEYKPV